jgi:signal transduction histidine kinase
MKTALRTSPYSRKPILRNISPEMKALPSMNAGKDTSNGNFRISPQGISPVISQATQNAGLTLSDSLALTKLKNGRPEATYKRFDIVALLHEVSDAGRSIAGDKPVTVMDVSCTRPVMIHSDQAQVRQIMMGLMSNAAKFTGRGRIALILSKEIHELRLTIADTGRGMAQEHINDVLDSYDHGYDVEMNGLPTSGLGLRIVKALVRQLHGSLSIASKPGEGTIVEVSLPLKPLQ